MRDKLNKAGLRQAFASRSLRAGGYSLAICAIALVIVVLVNLMFGKLPVKVTELDFSRNKLYSISDYSKKVAESIDTDVTIYHLTTAANENKQLSSMLRRYADLNDHIRVETRDPQVSQIASQYTKDELQDNSLIFVSDKRSKVVDYGSILGYSSDAQMYAMMYNQEVDPDEFNGEGEITSALSFVTTDVLPKVYTLTAHGEFELIPALQKAVTAENIELAELDLAKEKTVPQDCACLLILAPDTDLTQQELSAIKSYWENGGKLLYAVLMKSEQKADTPNADALLAELGLEPGDGFIIEGDQSMCYLYPNYLMPQVQSHEITDPLIEGNYHVYFPHARELSEMQQHRSSLQITPLLTTSEASFARSDMENASGEKAEGDTDGPFNTAYAITEDVDGKTAQAVVLATPYFLDQNFASSAGNVNLFLNSLKWMCELKENISVVETKSLSLNASLEVTENAFMLWAILLIVFIPAAVLITGVVIYAVRKKR